MSAAFPTISDQKQPYAWKITPNSHALERLAEGIWDCAKQTQQRPLVVLSTAGPLIGLRAALEETRPRDLPSQIAFLPQVISFADWLEAAPNSWKFPKMNPVEESHSPGLHLHQMVAENLNLNELAAKLNTSA